MKKKKPRKHQNPFYQDPSADPVGVTFPVRLNKYVAKSGICSRRKAVELVKDGKIKVNDVLAMEPYLLVEANDEVKYNDQIIKPETRMVYYLLNKPKQVITTTSDEHQRKTVLDLIKEDDKERLFPVGRLDRDTTGLILITNDGDLAKKLSHPSHKVRKEYLVTLDKDLSVTDFDKIVNGLELEDGLAPIKELRFTEESDKKRVIITLFIGRNRIVRRIFKHCGYTVVKLDRIYLAGLTKKYLPRGRYRILTSREVIMLKHFT